MTKINVSKIFSPIGIHIAFKYAISLTLERPHFQTTENERVRQLTHYVNKLYFVHLFDQVGILKNEISFAAP